MARVEEFGRGASVTHVSCDRCKQFVSLHGTWHRLVRGTEGREGLSDVLPSPCAQGRCRKKAIIALHVVSIPVRT